MKPSVIIALLVGAVGGFAVGKALGPTSGQATPPAIAANAAAKPAAPSARAPGSDDQTVYKVPIEGAPVRGSKDALVTMVEFSDYQCPFCSRAHNTVRQLEKEYGDKLRVVMKQNPLSFHPNAKPAALAALAAGEQGKYWEMHDLLFANQATLDDATYEKHAQAIGLDIGKWKESMQSPKWNDVIGKQQGEASSLGASGTPAFFINGRKLSGAQPIDNFKRLIDEELGKAQELVKSGVAADQVYAKVLEKGVASPPPAPTAPSAPAAPAAPPPSAVKKIAIPNDSPAKGPKVAKVTIVAWSDFQCPFCSRVVPTLAQIEKEYPKDVRVVFRHQPLPFHDKAKLAAEASMAAHEQGKFWQMHDKLFANQQALDRPNLEKYAQELGLDMGKFKNALDTNKFAKKVEADMAAGSEVGANGTPTFYINGREFVGAQPFESFKSMIDSEIKNADKLLAAGTKMENLYQKILDTVPAEPTFEVNIKGAPTLGPANAPVTIVAFSDFQCPFCSRVVPTLKEIEKTYGPKVKVVFKNQPLPFHDKARLAAAAGLAAHEQGKFWDMHDKLFANQQALDRPDLEKYAKEIGLDMGKFKAALDSSKFEKTISSDSEEGTRLGANGTPTFFINGKQLVGAQPIDQFKRLIDDELAKKK